MSDLFRAARPAPPRPKPVFQRGSAEAPWSVDKLSERIARVLGSGFPGRIWVEGELSRITRHRNGAAYLSLQEGRAVLEAVAWSEAARRLPDGLRQGDQVRVLGSVRTWKGSSRYQIQVERVERAGLGQLLQQLKELEIQLAREGLFSDARKRPLPRAPLRVGLLASRGSDGWRDFIDTARRRFPRVEILSWHSLVQGPRAPRELVHGLRQLARAEPDMIVITRGGGSFEDLLAFSDEAVVRAAAACPIPVVSAIGHDADRPLLDQAADVRAKTPTAAAEENVPDLRDLLGELDHARQSAGRAAELRLDRARRGLAARATHRGLAALAARIRDDRTRIAAARQAATDAARRRLDRAAAAWRERGEGLAARHPGERLERRKRAVAALRDRIGALDPVGSRWRRLPGLAARISPDRLLRRIEAARRDAARDAERARSAATRSFDGARARAERWGERVRGRNPLLVLQRGYSLALDAEGRVLRSSAQVADGDAIRVRLAEGGLDARVLKRHEQVPE